MRHRRARPSKSSASDRGTRPDVTIVTGGTTTPVDDSSKRRRSVGPDETNSFILRLVGRYGSEQAALTHLASEQLKYRRRAQDAELELDELHKQLPTDGSVVLTGDQATAYQALIKANAQFTLVGLDTQLKELGTLRDTTVKAARDKDMLTAAGTQYRVSLLKTILGDLPVSFKPKLVPTADDPTKTEEIQVPFVKQGDTLVSLDDYLQTNHKDLITALTIPADERDDSTVTTTDRPLVTMPKQAATTGGTKMPTEQKQVFGVVDKTLSTHMSPGQRRKEQLAGTK